MTTLRFHKPGERVKFYDGDTLIEGTCNGEPFEGEDGVKTHLPVYVHEGDRCLMVAMKNIVEWHT